MTAIAMASLLIECIDNLKGNVVFRQRTKNLANKFLQELEEIYAKFWRETELKDKEDAQLSLFAIEENYQDVIRKLIYTDEYQQQVIGFVINNPDIAREIVEQYEIKGYSVDLNNIDKYEE